MSTNQKKGRALITTFRKLTGDLNTDAITVAKIIEESLATHSENANYEDYLFKIYFNDGGYWNKTKQQRKDINNKISIDDAWSISRTINSYCFGEPIKYVARETGSDSGIQEKVETLSEFLDYQHNHDATIMATLCSSICGVGYKLALPANKEELSDTGIPFVINPNFINPQKAFVVYDSSVMHKPLVGVIIGEAYDEKKDQVVTQYTAWTKDYQFIYQSDDTGALKALPYVLDGVYYEGEKIFCNHIPLIEVERNAFRKGDWEVCTDLFELKNMLSSNRIDDVQQAVDYILVLINCKFENEDEKKDVINSRLFQLNVDNPQSKPDVQILKNALEQNGIQMFADYIDTLIEEVAGIPSRAERGNGGHDTGTAVKYRNGFRDLENNAGVIIPKMDKAEIDFLSVCIGYCNAISNNPIKGLRPYDIRNKFIRSLNDDVVNSATAYSTLRSAGMNDVDALIASKVVTDPAEVHKNNENEGNANYLNQMVKIEDTETTKNTNTEKSIDK